MSDGSNALDRFLTRLHQPLGERLRTDAEALAQVAGDESGLPSGNPAAVLWPLNKNEVVEVARAASELGVALVPRGGGTGKAGACIPGAGQVVVDFSRMNRLLELLPRDMYAVVQPGLITLELDQAAEQVGFMYPPDPGSFESCTLGGNISTNAGGMRAVKYGVTHRYVWGLEVVLANGDALRMGRRSIKGVAGYELTSLFVGAEGTLGFITEATLHIVPAPPAVETAWLSFSDLLAASRAAEAIFAAGILPRVFEVMDQFSLDAVRSTSPFPIPEGAMACALVETDGQPDQAIEDLACLAEIAEAHGASNSALATSEKQRQAMRRTRRLISSALKENYPYKISDDIAVPRGKMAEILERAQQMGAAKGFVVATYGHLGDGNVHVNLICANADEQECAREVRLEILKAAVALGGTVSGEHGLGIAKRDLLGLEHSPVLVQWQRRIKQLMDPQEILNPGKVLPRS